MPVPTSLDDLSPTPASNFPAGSEAILPNLDDYLRAHAGFLGQLWSLLKNAIMIHRGSVASIPDGWQLCDGTNGTPDLRDKFIAGAGGAYAVGATGGANEVTLSSAQMPSHGHTGTTAGAGVHGHGGSIGSSGSHTHTYDTTYVSTQSGAGVGGVTFGGPLDVAVNRYNSGSGGVHTHSLFIETAGNHSHSFTTGSVGGGQAHENRPPFYALAFIAYVGA